MKSICLRAWKITIENVITLLQVLSSSFIFLTFKDSLNAKLFLGDGSLILCDVQTLLITGSSNSNSVHLQTRGVKEAYEKSMWITLGIALTKEFIWCHILKKKKMLCFLFISPEQVYQVTSVVLGTHGSCCKCFGSHKCSWVQLANINQGSCWEGGLWVCVCVCVSVWREGRME